jgi:hypothetical protein
VAFGVFHFTVCFVLLFLKSSAGLSTFSIRMAEVSGMGFAIASLPLYPVLRLWPGASYNLWAVVVVLAANTGVWSAALSAILKRKRRAGPAA